MGGSIGVPVAPTTPAATTPVTTPAATTPATPQLVNRGAGVSTLPVSPTGPTGLPSVSNKGGGSATLPSPTFASDPVVAQPLPPVPQFQPTAGLFSPLFSQPAPPIIQQGNKGGGRTVSPSTGLTSIPLEPYGSPTDTTGTRDVTDVTELSRTTFDPALTARDTLDRIELIEKRFADQDAEKAAAAANAPTAAERQAEEDRKFIEQQRRIQQAEAAAGG
tara:strand:- start:48 stop:704 length:657 start_codon:yes stop_codon:yes gene_type:complete